MPGIDFDELREKITMEQVLKLIGFEPIHQRGDQWYGCCPLEGCPSTGRRRFSVNVSKGLYYCHGCQSKGNQLQLWAVYTKQSVRPAVIQLCEALDRDVPWMWWDG